MVSGSPRLRGTRQFIRKPWVFLAIAVVCLPACRPRPAAEPGALRQEAYVWQRVWTPEVREAVSAHSTNFSRLLVLAAEVSWSDPQPRVSRVTLDYQCLRECQVPIGLCLRIGPYPGPFADVPNFLPDLAASIAREAASQGITPAELQIDFDCAESKLPFYRQWLEAIRRRIAPVPVTLTALPSWLDRPAFKSLATSFPNYTLQVHALRRPTGFDESYRLCDPVEARRAIAAAAKLGAPFRVALPTYAYVLAFDPQGNLIALRAEGPAREWSPQVQTRELWADPGEIATLVRGLRLQRPSELHALAWYRLPVKNDRFNWRFATLAATMQGRSLRAQLRVESRRVEAGLVDITLVNEGELDISSRLAIKVRWRGSRYISADSLGRFEMANVGQNEIHFVLNDRSRLAAGERVPVGWLRFDDDREVVCEREELGSEFER